MRFPSFATLNSRILPWLLCLPLTACYAYPDSGHWKGQAVFRDELSNPVSCTVELDITHDDTFLALNDVATDCGARYTRWNPGAFNVRGMDVWKDTNMLGHVFSDGSVHLSLNDPYLSLDYPYPARHLVVNWTKVGNELQFSEEIGFDGNNQTLEAWLYRSDG
jgi:hypothetical protein